MTTQGISYLLEDHRTDGLRSGEGSAVVLRDGSLLLIYTDFDGNGDFSRGRLVERRSTDGGRTWTDKRVFLDVPAGSINLMSVSLLRLADGRIGCVYIHKLIKEHDDILFMTSADEGRTWSPPRSATGCPGYFCVNNDRLVQLRNGRLLIPYALHAFENNRFDGRGQCGCLLSDDVGKTWRFSHDRRMIQPGDARVPRLISRAHPDAFERELAGGIAAQEPGVIELADGRVMMWVRSKGGYAYRAESKDGGDTWSALTAIPEFAMPCGPQSIYRLPNSSRWVMFYNDRQGVAYGDVEFQWRTPLCVAVSDDEGRNWKRQAQLEDDRVNYCYLSACFFNDQVLLTYYEGLPTVTLPDGNLRRSNLVSMKVKVLPQSCLRD